MNPKNLFKALTTSAFVAMSFATSAEAAVVDSADVSGYKTFQDTNTGRIWLDMNNFFDASATVGTSGYDMIAAAQSAGFSFATRADTAQLLNSLSLSGGQWSSYASIMGYGVPRQLIWGIYDDSTGNPFGWAYAYSTDSSWRYNNESANANLVINQGIVGSVDMGIWAYQGGSPIPVPAAAWLLGSGLLGLIGVARRKTV